MLEERGVAIDDSGMDEEDLYGAVVRDVNPNKYVPPALRKQFQPQPQQQQQQQQIKKEAKANPLNKLITSDLPKAGGSNPSPIANLPTTRRESSEKSSEKVSFHQTLEFGRISNQIYHSYLLKVNHQRGLKPRLQLRLDISL
jgi:PAB1-binding protein PBP1